MSLTGGRGALSSAIITEYSKSHPTALFFQSGAENGSIDVYEDDLAGGINGPESFASGDTAVPTDSSDAVGVQQNGFFPQIYVPENYVFGSSLSDTSMYEDASFDSLGLAWRVRL
jgi:hypothetical protein